MELSRKRVEHIARLAKLELSDTEVTELRAELSAILGHFQRLQTLDTEDIPPTATVLPLRSVMREDEVAATLEPEEALRNAPKAEDGCYAVPPVLE